MAISAVAGRPAVRRSALAAVAVFLNVAGLTAGQGAADADVVADEQLLVARLQELRASRRLPALAVDARLTDVARAWSARMAADRTLAHTTDLGSKVGGDWTRLGQNVGVADSAEAVHTGMVASTSHAANMVSTSFNAVGVGVAAAAGRLWVTQVFVQAPVVAATAPAVTAAPLPAPTAGAAWYRLIAAQGDTYPFGAAGALPGVPVPSPVVGGAAAGGTAAWLVTSSGAVLTLGAAPALGSPVTPPLSHPVVGMAATPGAKGYWLVARDGGVFAFGDARFLGSTGGTRLNQPIVGMAPTPSGAGYWLVAADGGVFAFGDARFLGSTGAIRLNQPVVGMAATTTGKGYWLVARDGGVFAFGDAPFLGSTGATRLAQPIVGIAASSASGYRFVAADGGVFAFGDAPFLGSTAGRSLGSPVTAMITGG